MKEDNLRSGTLQRGPQRKQNYNQAPLHVDHAGETKPSVAPSPLSPLTPWIGDSPQADGKSPSAGPEGPTPKTAVVVEPILSIIFHRSFTVAEIRRSTDAGLGKAHPAAPESRGHATGGRSAAELSRAPPPKTTSTAPKRRTDRAAVSIAPPAATLLTPPLCTRRDPGFPHPPAAGAAGGGRGNRRIAAGEGGLTGWFKNSPLLLL